MSTTIGTDLTTNEACTCRTPLLDSDLDLDGDDDLCWRCHKPVLPPEEEPDE